MQIALVCCAAAAGCARPPPPALHNRAADPPRPAALVEAREAASQLRLAAFARPTCPGDACFTYVIGSNPRGGVGCPFVHRVGALRVQRLPATEGPLVGDFCCWLTELATARRGGVRLLRVSSERDRAALDCRGGPATATLDAIYRVDSDRLVLEADDSVVWP